MERPRHVLEEIDWEDTAIRLAAYVGYRSRRWAIPADVEDIVSETLCRVIDHDYKSWDPEAEPEFFRFCMSVANGLLRNLLRRAYRTQEVSALSFYEDVTPNDDSAAAIIIARDNARCLALLRQRVEGDEVAGRVLDFYADGVEKTRHIAEALGRSSPEVHNAKRRLLGHIDAVRAQMQEEVRDAG